METHNLNTFLLENKGLILEKWFDALLETYPKEAARLYKKEKDSFANPVGNNLYSGMEGILDWLLQGEASDEVSGYLDQIIRIRAVQDCLPSQAVSFLISLKDIVRKLMEKTFSRSEETFKSRQRFESQVDVLLLLAMDIYSQCRERLYEIKAGEVHHRVFALLRQANVLEQEKCCEGVSK